MFLFGLLLNSFANDQLTLQKIEKSSDNFQIIMCQKDSVNIEVVKKSISFWNKIENKIEDKIIKINCDIKQDLNNKILIKVDKDILPIFSGYANIEKDNTNKITGGVLSLNANKKNDQFVITHEIGHFLGYQHESNSKNVMYRYSPKSVSFNKKDYKIKELQ